MVPHSKNLEAKLSLIRPAMNEWPRRIIAASEAMELRYGGVSALAEMTGLSRKTLLCGMEDLKISKKIRKSAGDPHIPSGTRRMASSL